ncbi:hypothetical protein F4808DRAFT_473956 [Astrocystis sublimbata]|nr:hypothetical protein F4808DRAFT_473956 [Astrocystis sublimbata]
MASPKKHEQEGHARHDHPSSTTTHSTEGLLEAAAPNSAAVTTINPAAAANLETVMEGDHSMLPAPTSTVGAAASKSGFLSSATTDGGIDISCNIKVQFDKEGMQINIVPSGFQLQMSFLQNPGTQVSHTEQQGNMQSKTLTTRSTGTQSDVPFDTSGNTGIEAVTATESQCETAEPVQSSQATHSTQPTLPHHSPGTSQPVMFPDSSSRTEVDSPEHTDKTSIDKIPERPHSMDTLVKQKNLDELKRPSNAPRSSPAISHSAFTPAPAKRSLPVEDHGEHAKGAKRVRTAIEDVTQPLVEKGYKASLSEIEEMTIPGRGRQEPTRKQLSDPKYKARQRKNMTKMCKTRDLDDFIFFDSPQAEYGWLSQWWNETSFTSHGNTYRSAVSYVMCRKALMFDPNTSRMILKESCPKKVQELGRKIKNFRQEAWDEAKKNIVLRANCLNFRADPSLITRLLATGDKVLVNTAPFDNIWAVGLNKTDAKEAISMNSSWGLNLLGEQLMVVRAKYKAQVSAEQAIRQGSWK